MVAHFLLCPSERRETFEDLEMAQVLRRLMVELTWLMKLLVVEEEELGLGKKRRKQPWRRVLLGLYLISQQLVVNDLALVPNNQWGHNQCFHFELLEQRPIHFLDHSIHHRIPTTVRAIERI
jgi:hypothetical protein